MRPIRPLLAIGLLLAVGCGTEQRDISVGIHHLSVAEPDGWEYLDHGLENLFERERAQVSIKDLGPVTAPGCVSVVEASRELWRLGELEAARDRIRRVQIPRPPGTKASDHEAFSRSWYRLRSNRVSEDPVELEQAYAQVLDALLELPGRRVEDFVDLGLGKLDHDNRRDIASQERVTLGDHEWLVVDTWDRLSHDYRRRHAFVLNHGHLLVVWTKRGRFVDVEKAFGDVMGSLAIRVPDRAAAG